MRYEDSLKRIQEIEDKIPAYITPKHAESLALEEMKDMVVKVSEIDNIKKEIVDRIINERKSLIHTLRSELESEWKNLQRTVEADCQVSDNPKNEMAWRMAYERGHSSGYRDIVYNFIDLAELIR